MGKKAVAKLIVPVAGRDYVRQANGVLVVGHQYADITAPYDEAVQIPNYLQLVDHDLALKKKHYEKELEAAEREFNELVRGKLEKSGRSVIVVLQGRDGAGKTGARKRLGEALDDDAKIFQSISIGPPHEDERKHPFLWRFFTGERMPRYGEVRVFDRSWAERVLVEPVMKFTSEELVRKSYAQIRAFEWNLENLGGIVVKFWMDISKDEQKKRFEERARDKAWKLTDSDEVAREHWDDYTVAANEMFHRTGTSFAPWHIVASEDKYYSRVTVLQVVNQAIRKAIG